MGEVERWDWESEEYVGAEMHFFLIEEGGGLIYPKNDQIIFL